MRYHLKLGLLFCLFCDVSLGVIKVSENPLVIICFVISFVSSLYLTHVTCATWCCSLLGATGFDTKLFVTIPRIVTTFLSSSQLSSQFLSSSRISQSSLLRWSDIFGGWRKNRYHGLCTFNLSLYRPHRQICFWSKIGEILKLFLKFNILPANIDAVS